MPDVTALRVLIALAALSIAIAPAFAEEDSDVAPDRPDVTNSTQTVPFRAVQIEVGLEYARMSLAARTDDRRFVVQGALRFGLTDRLEGYLDGEPLVRLRGEDEDTGNGDLELGLKYRFLDQPEGAPWPSLGLQPFVKFPAAAEPIGSGRPDFGMLLLASLALPWQLGLDVNAGLVAVGQTRPSEYLVQGLGSASLSREVAERLSAFVEIFYASREERDGRYAVGFNTGLVFLLRRRLALDAAVATTLAGRGPDYAVRTGISLRWGR